MTGAGDRGGGLGLWLRHTLRLCENHEALGGEVETAHAR